MAISNEQFKELIETIKYQPQPIQQHHLINSSPNANLWDVMMKIAIPLMTIGIATLIGNMWNLDKKFSQFEIRQQVQEEVIDDLGAFAKEPRFTQNNFLNQLEPLKQQVIINGADIDKVQGNIIDIRSRITGLEKEIEVYKRSN